MSVGISVGMSEGNASSRPAAPQALPDLVELFAVEALRPVGGGAALAVCRRVVVGVGVRAAPGQGEQGRPG